MQQKPVIYERFGNQRGSGRCGADQWYEGRGLCDEPAREVLGSSNRSNIELLEEGLSSERYDDNERGTRYQQEEVGNRIIENAKAHGLFIPIKETQQLGERYDKSSGESVVYYNDTDQKVYKIKDPFAKYPIKGHAVSDVLYEHILHNMLFPNVPYTLEGVSEDLGDLRLVFSQPYLRACFEPATQKQIDDFLTNKLGLMKVNRYFYSNEYCSITDIGAVGDNVLVDDSGTLYFIDPIIKFKMPAYEALKKIKSPLIRIY